MGTCCEAEHSNLTFEERKGRRIASSQSESDLGIDGIWLGTYSGRVYSACTLIQIDPSSFQNSLDRVFGDLVAQYVGVPGR